MTQALDRAAHAHSFTPADRVGVRVARRYTRAGANPLDEVKWDRRRTVITNPDGSVVFQMDDVEVPAAWSQLATDIVVSKYFRKAGLPTPPGHETSVRQVVYRIARSIREWGESQGGYFAAGEDADAFEAELTWMLVHQVGAFNSPVWFNCGLWHQYRIGGSGGNFSWDPAARAVQMTHDSYSRPQVSACFIQSVDDDLMSIFELARNEARVFKFGSGSGTNFSRLRGRMEKLSGGGTSSGLMSFLEVLDKGAGATKSGGTTRRAAKMVVLDLDHPEILDFVRWKVREEKKVAALVAAGYSSDFNGDAYGTVSGQNSNNSVRVPDRFMDAVVNDGSWQTTMRTTGAVHETFRARVLWREIAESAWQCADPGVQFDDTIQKWHTCSGTDRIYATNPCSEFVFLDDTACNLASINLMKFLREDGSFDIEGYRHTNRIFFLAQEILVGFASYPTEKIARRSHEFRPLGLGYANLGTLLMMQGLPYDSEGARAYAACVTAIMTGEAYALSAEMAASVGPFEGFVANREPMLEVMRLHQAAARQIDASLAPRDLRTAAIESWDRAVALGALHGYRNSQASVLAPTGCLVGHSLVATERGLVPLNTLGNPDGKQWQDVSVSVHTDEGPRVATRFFINGLAMTRRLKTACGYEIQGTPEHRIKVIDPETGEMVWRRFAEIREGDQVPLALNTQVGSPRTVKLPPLEEMHWNGIFDTQTPPEITPELAELVGYFMGDGSLHSKGLRFCVSEQDADVLELLTARIRKLFNLEAKVELREHYWEVAVNSVLLALWWKACGFVKHKPQENHTGKGYAPHIPNALLYTNNREVYAAFLRGLYEADGTVSNGAPCWSTARDAFSQQVKTLLLAMGYPTTTKIDHSGWGASDLFVLRLRSFTYNSHFLNEIGFIGQRKRLAVQLAARTHSGKRDFIPITADQLEELVPAGSPYRNAARLAHQRKGGITRGMARRVCGESGDARLEQATRFFYDYIVANEDGGEQLTYDLSVPSNVTYTAGGFISHNTIGLLMDCDTTGVEPDFALVKFKKLAGGGYFKIANQSVPAALRRLGYDDPAIARIVRYAVGHGTFEGAPHVNRASLTQKGLTLAEIDRLELALPSMLDVRFAFVRGMLSDDTLTRLGVGTAEREKPGFQALPVLGFTEAQVAEANAFICGNLTVEGAPGLRPEHLPVFDCANRCGPRGTRYIQPLGHVRMMGAVQPFISGAISKTVNLPQDATVGDVEHIYFESWKQGLKAVALYRDGSKLSQPLSTGKAESTEETAETAPPKLLRRRLPKRRHGFTQEARLGGHKVFLRTGEYEDGTLGEIFIDMHKEGAAFRSMMNCFAISVSMGLQYGVPLEDLVDQFVFTRFEPGGRVEGHDNLRACTSVVDYVFRVLGIEYLDRTDLAHIVTEDLKGAPVASMHATGHPVGKEHRRNGGDGHPAESDAGPAGMAAPSAHAAPAPASSPGPARSQRRMEPAADSGQDALLSKFSGDAPLCDQCGHITVRNGTCFKCLNCGTSMGCS